MIGVSRRSRWRWLHPALPRRLTASCGSRWSGPAWSSGLRPTAIAPSSWSWQSWTDSMIVR